MGGSHIEITKEALKLFIKSLLVGRKSGVLSFGGKTEWCKKMVELRESIAMRQ
jgi:hypothetical protein